MDTIDSLIEHVTSAYWSYPTVQLDHAFITLQIVLDKTLKSRGSNGFKIPHIGKRKLRDEGLLLQNVPMSQGAREVFDEFWHGELTMP